MELGEIWPFRNPFIEAWPRRSGGRAVVDDRRRNGEGEQEKKTLTRSCYAFLLSYVLDLLGFYFLLQRKELHFRNSQAANDRPPHLTSCQGTSMFRGEITQT